MPQFALVERGRAAVFRVRACAQARVADRDAHTAAVAGRAASARGRTGGAAPTAVTDGLASRRRRLTPVLRVHVAARVRAVAGRHAGAVAAVVGAPHALARPAAPATVLVGRLNIGLAAVGGRAVRVAPRAGANRAGAVRALACRMLEHGIALDPAGATTAAVVLVAVGVNLAAVRVVAVAVAPRAVTGTDAARSRRRTSRRRWPPRTHCRSCRSRPSRWRC